MRKSTFFLGIFATMLFLFSCGNKNNVMGLEDHNKHEHGLIIHFSYRPDPAVINTGIAFRFEVKDENNAYVSVGNSICEISGAATVELIERGPGYYIRVITFNSADEYKVYFRFTYEGIEFKEEFSVTVE